MTKARDLSDNTQNTKPKVVDAKGDLIAATGADTADRLAVGNNGETLVADSSATTGLRYTAGTVQSNPVLNSNFSIAQRGTSFAAPSAASYTFDRWNVGNAQGGRTWSRQTPSLDGFEYCVRIQRDSGTTGASLTGLSQSLESVNSIPYQGKTITISAYVRKGADFSGASSVAKLFAASGTGTNQKFQVNGTSYTGQSIFIDQSITLTTSWERFSATATVSTAATELAFGVSFTPVGTAGAADYLEFTGFQVDVGSVALPFRTYAGTIQGELAACQRYYFRQTAGAAGQHFSNGNNETTTKAVFVMPFPTIMRIAPTALEQSGTAGDYSVRHQATSTTASAVPAFESASTYAGIFTTTVASGLTAGNGSFARPVNSTAYLGWSAEL